METGNTAQASISSNRPLISNFEAIHESGNVWTFRGRVTDESPQGLVVTFGGIPSLANQTATVGADGWFYLTIVLAAGEEGTATARVTDWWGLESTIAEAIVRW